MKYKVGDEVIMAKGTRHYIDTYKELGIPQKIDGMRAVVSEIEGNEYGLDLIWKNERVSILRKTHIRMWRSEDRIERLAT